MVEASASSTLIGGGLRELNDDWSSGDHALIDIGKLLGLNPRQVTVRTKSRDAQSADSAPTPIPTSILRGKGHKVSAPRLDASVQQSWISSDVK